MLDRVPAGQAAAPEGLFANSLLSPAQQRTCPPFRNSPEPTVLSEFLLMLFVHQPDPHPLHP